MGNLATPRGSDFLEKLIVAQHFLESDLFIMVFTKDCQRPLSLATWTNSMSCHCISIRSALILLSHLNTCLPSSLHVFVPKLRWDLLVCHTCCMPNTSITVCGSYSWVCVLECSRVRISSQRLGTITENNSVCWDTVGTLLTSAR
jgi:hypothetical protein